MFAILECECTYGSYYGFIHKWYPLLDVSFKLQTSPVHGGYHRQVGSVHYVVIQKPLSIYLGQMNTTQVMNAWWSLYNEHQEEYTIGRNIIIYKLYPFSFVLIFLYIFSFFAYYIFSSLTPPLYRLCIKPTTQNWQVLKMFCP